MCTSKTEANDVLFNGLQVLIEKDETCRNTENLNDKIEASEVENESLKVEGSLSNAELTQNLQVPQDVSENFSLVTPEGKIQNKEATSAHKDQTLAKKSNEKNFELEYEKNCDDSADLSINLKEINIEKNADENQGDSSCDEDRHDVKGCKEESETSSIKLEEVDIKEDLDTNYLENHKAKGETRTATETKAPNVNDETGNKLINNDTEHDIMMCQFKDGREELMVTQIDDVTNDTRGEYPETGETTEEHLQTPEIQLENSLEKLVGADISERDHCFEVQNKGEDLTLPLKNYSNIHTVENQENIESNVLLVDFKKKSQVSKDKMTIEVEINWKENDACDEMESVCATEKLTNILSEAHGNQTTHLGTMLDNGSSHTIDNDDILQMTFPNALTNVENLYPKDILDCLQKRCNRGRVLQEKNACTNEVKPALDSNEEFLLLTSTLLKDIAKETNYYTVNEKILNSTVSRTSLWNTTSEQSSLKRRSNSMGNCRKELILSPNHLQTLNPLNVPKNQYSRRTSESPSHDADASSVSSYRYSRSRQNSSFRQERPCTVMFQDLGVTNSDEDTKDSARQETFRGKSSKRVDSISHFWLMHSILSVTGMIVFSIKNFEDFDYKKFAFTAVHGVVIIFATVYTITFYARGELPPWFVVYTLPFLGMHFYALGLQIHSIKERKSFKTFLLSFKRLEFERSNYYTLGPVVSLVYSLINLGFLFVAMPAEAYGITVALLPSIFNPGMYDMYMIMIARALTNSYKLIEDEAKHSKPWTAKHSRIFERKLKELYQTLKYFNQTFSKNLLSRRTLFLFQLLSNTYVITAIINLKDSCLQLFICTLIPCMEILARLYILCSHGDRLMEQYRNVHHVLLKIYYSLDGAEMSKTGRTDSRSFERGKPIEKANSSAKKIVIHHPKLMNEGTTSAGDLFSSSTSNNLTEKKETELCESFQEKRSAEQARHLFSHKNKVDFKNSSVPYIIQLNNENTRESETSDTSLVPKSESNEHIKNEFTSTNHCYDLESSRNFQQGLEDHTRSEECNDMSFSSNCKSPIEYEDTILKELEGENTSHINITENINVDTDHESTKSLSVMKVEQSLISKGDEVDLDVPHTPKLETVNDEGLASARKMNVTETLNDLDKSGKTSTMDEGLLTSWSEFNGVEIKNLNLPLHLNHGEASTAFGTRFAKADVSDDLSLKSSVNVKVEATDHLLIDPNPELNCKGIISEKHIDKEVSQTNIPNFTIPQIVISDFDCTPSFHEDESSVLTLSLTKSQQNPLPYTTNLSVLQPPTIMGFNDNVEDIKNSTDKFPVSKVILNDSCLFSTGSLEHMSNDQYIDNITKLENTQNEFPKGKETLLLQSWSETNSGKLRNRTTDETHSSEQVVKESNQVSSLESVHVDEESFKLFLPKKLGNNDNKKDSFQDTEPIECANYVVHTEEGDPVSNIKISRKFLHPEEATKRKIYGSVCEFNFEERMKKNIAFKPRQRKKKRITGKQRLAMLLGRLEMRQAEMRISGDGRLGSESLVSLLGVTITFIAVLVQMLPDRPLGSSAIQGCYDSCFYYKD